MARQLLDRTRTSPFLIRIDGKVGGFTLVRRADRNSIAEFFIMPRFRRRGVGVIAARQVFELFGGEWSVYQIKENTGAVEFWRRAIPVAFEEACDARGTTRQFRMPA